mmetsp:Transcript_7930/g.16601  ORF Transcript_7930/g.16601 Transcript_7930/m.16601 type:complete len:732 (+) Transcript_7930:94-2289(+)
MMMMMSRVVSTPKTLARTMVLLEPPRSLWLRHAARCSCASRTTMTTTLPCSEPNLRNQETTTTTVSWSTRFRSTSTTTNRLWSTAAAVSDHHEEESHSRHNNNNNNNNSNVVPFLLADIGEGIQEVQVLEWNVEVGDVVQQFDSICQVQSDKATVDITSRFAGTIVKVANAGNSSPEPGNNSNNNKIQVGEPLVWIQTNPEEEEDDSAAAAAAASVLTESHKTSLPPASSSSESASSSPPMAPSTSATAADSNNDNDIVPFLLADIGEGIKEVEVLQWYVQVGDQVKEFDTICQVQSDKASVEITSRFAGTIVEINPSKSSHIQVGEPLVYIRTAGGGKSSSSSSSSTTTALAETVLEQTAQSDHANQHRHDSSRLQIPSTASHYALDSDVAATAVPIDGTDRSDTATSSHNSQNSSVKYLASPAVRKLAADHQINVRAIPGTGPQGRILKADILQYIQKTTTTSPKSSTTAAASSPTAPGALQQEPQQEEPNNIVTMTGYNKFMVQSMTDSLQIPHMGLGDEIVVDKLLEFRRHWNASVQQQQQQDDGKLGMQTLLIKACSMALKEYPHVNAKTHNIEECQVCVHENHDIGVAMDTPHGLVVPVIRNAQTLTLLEIQQELNRLKAAASSGNIALSDLSPSPTFTLSNIGAVGVGTHMSPVLVPPMIAMGALGRIHKLPRFDEHDNVVATNVLYASWSADHRFLDGATLARFHKAFAKYASDPLQMLPHLK